MELKKNVKVNQEDKKSVYLEYGLVLTLAIILLAFEVGNAKLQDVEEFKGQEDSAMEEDVMVTRDQPPPPPPPPPPPKLTIDAFNIVDNDEDVDDFDIDIETDMDEGLDNIAAIDNFDTEEEVEETVFIIVENMPSFKGGDLNDFRIWVSKNLKYPQIAQENGIQGRVYVQFAVNSAGNVCDVKVLRGVDPALDEEAVRVIKSSPKWTPGKQRGRPVKVQFNFPVAFVLQ